MGEQRFYVAVTTGSLGGGETSKAIHLNTTAMVLDRAYSHRVVGSWRSERPSDSRPVTKRNALAREAAERRCAELNALEAA